MPSSHSSALVMQQSQDAAAVRHALVNDFPEIDTLCSDAYLAAVLAVPDRTFEYAVNEKVKKALQWRRQFNVDGLCRRFRYDMEAGVFLLLPAGDVHRSSFEPSHSLLKLCQTQALRILPTFDVEGRVVIFAETQLLDWYEIGVEVALQYHVLVIEAALDIIRSSAGERPEAITLLVDASGPVFAKPPPISAFQGLASLLQRAYPDRIHRIIVGPVNLVVRSLYRVASRFLSKSSRAKISLVGSRPSLDALHEEAPSSEAMILEQVAGKLSTLKRTEDDVAVHSDKLCSADTDTSLGSLTPENNAELSEDFSRTETEGLDGFAPEQVPVQDHHQPSMPSKTAPSFFWAFGCCRQPTDLSVEEIAVATDDTFRV